MEDVLYDIGFQLHARQWGMAGTARPILLVHGLSSNAQTWDGVARVLADLGHPVVAIDQRGHGRSEKLEIGYDFTTICRDLRNILAYLKWDDPLMIGQSWGGNVMLAFADLHPRISAGFVWVDGGYIDLQRYGPWEQVVVDLKPPPLAGMRLGALRDRLAKAHPEWSAEGIEGTLANFEHLSDGTIRPWLAWSGHRQILQAMWQQRPLELYPKVQEPVLIVAAARGAEPDQAKLDRVNEAAELLPNGTAHWFTHTDHDIHVHRPKTLAQLIHQFQTDHIDQTDGDKS